MIPMNDIQRLEAQLDEAQSLLAQQREAVEADTEDFAARLTMQSMEAHRNELQRLLQQEKKERRHELVEYRLIGPKARGGSLPLGLLGDLAKLLERQIYAAAYFLNDGKRLVRRVPRKLRDLMDLRLAGLQPGSTTLVVAGDLSPDLFGQSLLEETFERIFELLHAEGAEELSNQAGEVGPIGAKKLGEFFDAVQKNGLELEITWNGPRGEPHRWQGDAQRLESFSESVRTLHALEPERMEVEGTITLLSARGQLEIETEDGSLYRISYAPKLQKPLSSLHLYQTVTAVLDRHVIENQTTGTRKATYRLIGIEPNAS